MNTPSKEALAPITADELAEARRLLAGDDHASIQLGLVRVARSLLPRLLSEREPVGDGEVENVIHRLDHVPMTASNGDVHRQVLNCDHDAAIALLRRLARQYAGQKALLAEVQTGWDGLSRVAKLPKDWLARRDALLNQEGGK